MKVEARIRDQIALGNWGILERQPAPILSDFLKDHFIPWVSVNYSNQNTRANYSFGARQLLVSNLASIAMDAITSEHTSRYVADHANLTASGINQGLRTLQRALSLALEWGKISRKASIALLKETKRERVVTEEEEEKYLKFCREPWRTAAVVMLDCGLRPDEVTVLRWERNFDWSRGLLIVREGKTDAAARTLCMSERMIDALRSSCAQETGFVFPAMSRKSRSGHVSQQWLWKMHSEALKESGVAPFEPYCLRHTCLTRMGEYTELPTLKVIAGHTDIRMTMRYVHPQARSVEAAFGEQHSRHKNRHSGKMRIVRSGGKGK